jgi:hypothetical protein
MQNAPSDSQYYNTQHRYVRKFVLGPNGTGTRPIRREDQTVKRSTVFFLMGLATAIGALLQPVGQAAVSNQTPWLEQRNPTHLEWLALEKQATEGDNEFGDNGITVNFYLSADSIRTGEVQCDLAYLSSTPAIRVQIIEDGILKRFETERRVNPWARVKIRKRAVP